MACNYPFCTVLIFKFMAFRPILCSGRTTAFADPAKKFTTQGPKYSA